MSRKHTLSWFFPLSLITAACATATTEPSDQPPIDVERIKLEQNRKWEHMVYMYPRISKEITVAGVRIPWVTCCEPADDLRVKLVQAYPNVDAYVDVDEDVIRTLEQGCCDANGEEHCSS